MTMKRMLTAVILAAAALAVPATALAAGFEDGRIVLGGSYTLASGETLNGDLLIVGGNVTLENGSTVTGNVFLLGGNINAGGEIQGDVSLVGGNLNLGAQAHVRGDVSTFGGNLTRETGARIDGQVNTGQNLTPPTIELPWIGRTYLPPEVWTLRFSPITQGLWFLVRTLLMAALAVLVVMFFPEPTGRVAKAVVQAPVVAGALGALTGVVVPALLIALAITICLIPVSLLGAMALVVAIVFGWIAVGLEVGRRLAEMFKWQVQPAAAAGLGTLVVTFVADGIGFIPCVGWLAPALVGSLGLGAVLLTRFGSQIYVGATAAPPALPPEASAGGQS